jgi:Kinesin motor domain
MQESSRGPPLRVQVAVRIRRPFQEEVLKWSVAPGSCRRAFYNAVERVHRADAEHSVCCTLPDGRQRRFNAHHVFGSDDSAAKVYTSIAAPIVAQVLGGRCGAIIAYGQTGSGTLLVQKQLLSCIQPCLWDPQTSR